MIAIDDGFTSISAGCDPIDPVSRLATGARVTVDFHRAVALAVGEPVRVRHEFAGNGDWRECTGIPLPIRTVVRWGRAVVYHYRLSYWVPAAALLDHAGTAARPRQPRLFAVASVSANRPANEASAGDRFHS